MFPVPPLLPRPIILISWVAVVALTLLAGCATKHTLGPMEDTADASDAIVEDGKYHVTVSLLTPTFSEEVEALPTFSIAFTNQSDDLLFIGPERVAIFSGGEPVELISQSDLIRRMREDNREKERPSSPRAREVGSGSSHVFDRQTSFLVSTGSSSPAIQKHIRMQRAAEWREMAFEEEEMIASAQRTDASLRKDQWKEAALVLTRVRVPPRQTSHRLLKLNPEQIRLGEPLRIEVELEGETYTFTFFAEASRWYARILPAS